MNFFRLARAVYDYLQLDCGVEAQLHLYGIKEFLLKPYHPEAIGYLDRVFHQPRYARDELRSGAIQVPADFDPDNLALRVLERVYGRFGYKREHIPFFDEHGKFLLA
ncbi:MAG: hypothetical protein HY660_06380 [Armatimonadetes bacterium]|nr:hypothetical protein [Armatimonadota bacterium]